MVNTVDVSFIVPMYNVEEWIAECIESLLAVNLNKEIIVVDDSSTDSSATIVDKYVENDNFKVVLYNQSNSGVSVARNYGLSKANGKYISFVDSDDFVLPKEFEKLFNKAKEHDLEVAIGGVTAFNSQGQSYQMIKSLAKLEEMEVVTGVELLDSHLSYSDNPSSCWNKLYRRDFLQNGKIKFVNGMIHEDVPFSFSVFLKAKKVAAYSICFYKYRLRDGSITHSKNINGPKGRLKAVEIIMEQVNLLNVNNKNINNFLVYQLYQAWKQARVRDFKLMMKMFFKQKVSLKKYVQILLMCF